LSGKKEKPNIEDLGNGKYRIRWQFKDSTGKWRSRQRDIISESEKDAKKVLDDIKYEIRHNTFIDKSRLTVGEQVKTWYNFHQTQVADKTRTRYEQSIRLHIIPGIGHMRLQNLGKQEVEDFYLSITRKDGKEGELGKGTLAWIHTTLNQVLDDALDKELILKNPMTKIKAPKGAAAGEIINPLNQDQTSSFLEHAKKDRFFELWLTFLGTGCRPEELFGLKRTRIDFRNKTITIKEVVICDHGTMKPKPLPKTKRSYRTIKISDVVVEALKTQLEKVDAWKQKVGPKLFKDNGLVFPSETGGYLNPSNLRSRYFKPILVAAELPDIRMYDLSYPHLNKIRTFSKRTA
jgi:integrase